jgi:DNA polymerase-3 subunit gamma/tau
MTANALITKYRPQEFDEIYGQDAVVESLKAAIENQSAQCFLFSGPSGCGKTTLARIAARKLGCAEPFREIDGATKNGIDEMREVQSVVHFRPLNGEGQAVILDECHRLTGNAWDSLLKVTEEPPPNVYWFFCTTQPNKINKTIVTRCLHLPFKSLSKELLSYFVDAIAEAEGIRLRPDVRQIIISKADGSPRQALTNLNVCRSAQDRATAAELLNNLDDNKEAIELMRLLSSKAQPEWKDIMQVLNNMNGVNPEAVRIQALNYFGACAKGAKTDNDAAFYLQLMENFTQSYASYEANAMLLRSIGLCIFRG